MEAVNVILNRSWSLKLAFGFVLLNLLLASPCFATPPPSITVQPTNQTVHFNDSVTFQVTASSQTLLSYQWYKNGSAILLAISSSYTILAAQTNDQATYWVKVSNLSGSVTSSHVTLTVLAQIIITNQPSSIAVAMGGTASFLVGAAGMVPIGYQWKFSGTNTVDGPSISGSTNATLTLSNVQTNNAGNYKVVLTNPLGSVTSSVALLTVYTPPGITAQPQSQTLLQGQTASFSVMADSTSPAAYQWYLNGSSMGGGAQSATLTLANINAGKAGNYTVVITNLGGSTTSAVAALTIYGIQTQPLSQAVVEGQNASLSVVPSGPAPSSYQWSFNGSAVSDATNALLNLGNAQTNQAGSYQVVIMTPVGSITSQVATLTVNVPAFITGQPQSLIVTQGQTARFTVAGAGTPSLTYAWYVNGTNLPAATNATLTFTNVQAAKAGNYTAVVNNSWGSATSVVATLTVYVPPSISPQPSSQALVQGQNALFSVGAAGTLPLMYQWNFNGLNLDNATNSSLILNTVQTNDAGSYTVMVTNVAGSVTSSVATLTVYVPPTITTQPQSLTLLQGQTAAFSVLASGSSPFTNQWYFNGSSLGAGAQGSMLTLNNISASKAGNYTVVVTNPGGSATSAVAVLTIYGIQTQPQNLTVVQGQAASFSVVPSGPTPLGYQWAFNGSVLSSATNASLNLTNASTNQVGGYLVVIATPVGSITSQVATLTVNVPAFITSQPQSLIVTQGQTARFTVVGAGTPNLNYQWYFNGANMGGGSAGPTLTLNGVGTNNAGNYNVVVNNSWGSSTSAVAALTVYVPPSISPQPLSLTLIQGQNALFSIGAAGTLPLSYQWNFNGLNLDNATNSSLTLNTVQTNDAGNYTVVVTNVAGSVTSSVATLTVYVPPTITTQPQSLTLLQNQTAAFSVLASGSSPLTNQWYFNGSSLGAGAQGSTLTLNNINASKAGNYTVVVANPGGTVTSAVAVLTIYGIQTQPQNLTVVQGQAGSFSVVPSGPTPLGYQWAFNGSVLSSATNASLNLTNASTNQVGSYLVVIATPVGSITSQVATLTVNVPAFITGQPQSLIVTQGQTAKFTVVGAGTPNLNYQWYFNGAKMGAGSASTTLNLNGVGTNNAGNYAVVVNNSWGSSTSTVAALTVYVPPSISPQPLSLAIIQGQNALFSIGAAGTLPLSYQWNFNGANLGNATNATLSISNAQTNNGGNYTVVVTNVAGSVTSSVATLTVYVPPTITTQPQSLTLLQGQTAAFSVLASGSSPFTNQWYFNGSSLGAGAQGSTLTLNNINASKAGNYTVVVTNPGGSVTSAVAVLTIYGIQTQPQNLTLVQGQAGSFSVVPSGPTPLGYQWAFNGSVLSSATNASLNLTNASTNQVGGYLVVIATPFGSITSQVATLTVNVPAFITSQPQSLIVTQGQTARFTVVGAGTPNLNYQWYFNGANMGGGSAGPTLTLNGVGTNNAGNYNVVVNNSWGSSTSRVVALTVYVPPSISPQPLSLAIIQGQNALFSIGAAGTLPLSYQWNLNGANLINATNSTLTLNNVQTNNGGSYTVVVTNVAGSVTSSVATLTVYVPPTITTQPFSLAVVQGQNPTFSVAASGTSPFSYQWRFDGVALAGGVNAALTLSNVQSNKAGSYSVVVTNAGGSVTSVVATLTVYVPAGIIAQPQSQTVVSNQNAAFSVVASGTAPFSYQWRFGGAALPGETNSALALNNVRSANGGAYTVVVTNSWGSVTSAVGTLTVLVPAGITAQPQSQAVVQGQSPTFSVAVSGTAPFSYQWSFNGSPLGGAASAALTLSNVQSNKAGNYTVVVTNIAGSVTSTVATLTVYVPAGISTQPLSQTATQGQTAVFSVVASGTTPFSYQWQFSGSNLRGATNASLVVTNLQLVQAGQYMVTVTNPWGAAVSAPALLTVLPPAGSDQPLMQGLVVHLTFDKDLTDSSGRGNHAAAVGAPNLVPGFIGAGGFNPFNQGGTENYATLGTPSDLSFGTSTDFSVAFWARLPAGGWNGDPVYDDPSFLSNKDWSNGYNDGWVLATGPNGKLQLNYSEGGNRIDYNGPAGVFGNPIWHHVAVTFKRTGKAITYFEGLPVRTNFYSGGGNTIDTGLPTNIGNDGTGNYTSSYWTNAFAQPTNGLAMDDVGIWRRALTAGEICGIYNAGLVGQDLSTVTSNNLTLVARPRILQQPASLEVLAGSNPALSVNANGTAPAYQWYGNGIPIPGATGVSLTISNIQPPQAGDYYVVITNSAGSTTSAVATLIVDAPPWIIAQPQSQTAAKGQTASFSVIAGGMAPLSYQWSFNNTALADATNSALMLTNLQPSDAGSYTVVIANVLGFLTSAAATLTVNVPPGITSQPQNQAVSAGQSASFSVTASGTAPLSYQWCVDGVALSGATAAVLMLADVHTTNAGSYTVMVSNSAGSIASGAASLTVTNPIINLAAGRGQGMTTNGFTFHFLAPVGATYVIQASTNFTDWIPIATNVALTADVLFTDIKAANYNRRLYRLMVP